VVKTKARTDALFRSDAEDVGEHSLRRVKPASPASTKRRGVIMVATLPILRRTSLIFMILFIYYKNSFKFFNLFHTETFRELVVAEKPVSFFDPRVTRWSFSYFCFEQGFFILPRLVERLLIF